MHCCPEGRAVEKERKRQRGTCMSSAAVSASLYKFAYYHTQDASFKMSDWPCALSPVIVGERAQ